MRISFGLIFWLIFSTLCMGQSSIPPLLLTHPSDSISPIHLTEKTSAFEPFQIGELLVYEFQFGFLDAAEATVQLLKHPSTDSLIIAEATGQSLGAFNWFFKVHDVYRSTMIKKSGYPKRFERAIQEGGYELSQDYQFDWNKGHVQTRTSKGGHPLPSDARTYLLDEPMHDMISSLFALRSLSFDSMLLGDTLTLPLFMDEEKFPLRLMFGGVEEVHTEEGTWDCLVFHPIIQTGRIWKNPDDLTVFVSDDDNHIPIMAETRILFGNITMKLTHAEGLRNPSALRPD